MIFLIESSDFLHQFIICCRISNPTWSPKKGSEILKYFSLDASEQLQLGSKAARVHITVAY